MNHIWLLSKRFRDYALESDGLERYRLHQVVTDYGRAQLEDVEAYDRFVAYMTQYVVTHEEDDESLEKELANILTALNIAFEKEMYTELIQGVTALAPFFKRRGLVALSEVQLLHALHAAQVENDRRASAALLLYIGEVSEIQGDYTRAEGYLEKSLILAHQL